MKPILRGLLGAGLTAATLVAAAPSTAWAAPSSYSAVLRAAAVADYDQKLAVAVKFGSGDLQLAELADRDFVIALWNLIKDNSDHLEVRIAAELAFSANPEVDPDASYRFIITDVHAAFDRDVEREKLEADAKRRSDLARAAAAASIDIVADTGLLAGSDADFVRLIWERIADTGRWPKVKAAATAALGGTDADRQRFIATGLAEAAKQDTDDRIAADKDKTEAEKARERARAAKKLAANRIGLTVTDELLDLPDRDFVSVVWNHADEGSEVHAAAVAAARSLDPAVWAAFIETGVHQAKDRDIQIALDNLYKTDKQQAEQIKATATANGDLNLAHAVTRALAGTPTELGDFLRLGQYDLDLTTGFETGDVQPAWPSPAVEGHFSNVTTTGIAATTEKGHTGTSALLYSGTDTNTLSSYAYLRVGALSRVAVKPTTTLSYWIYPQSTTARPEVKTRNSTCVAVDLLFSDGSTLRDSGLKDQSGVPVHPTQQCGKLVADRWNQVVVKLGATLVDKQVTSVLIGYDQPANAGGFRGLIDDLTITDAPVTVEDPGTDAVDYPVDPPRNDFTSDGNADVFARNAAGELRLYRGNGKGSWIDPSTNILIGTGWDNFTAVFPIGDFNGDKTLDVAARNAAGELRLYRGNGKGSWVDPSTSQLIGTGWNQFNQIFSPGDFTGDGFADVIARNAAGELRLYRGNGKGGWIDPSTNILIGTGWNQFNQIFSPGDFTGDGFPDVIGRNAAGELRLYRGDGKGSWIDPSTNILIGTGWGSFTSVFSPGDFTGDGFADVIARNTAGELRLYRGNGKGSWIDPSTNILIGTGWNQFNLIF
ncbi:MAG TPA: FG-GAP-like repeat-containing protein [Actinoplanes sp.]